MNDRFQTEGTDRGVRSLVARSIISFCVVALCGAATSTAGAQSTAEIFSRLDRAAQLFSGATASIRVTTHTEIIDEDEIQIGTVVVKRYSRNEMRFLINFTGQDAQAIALRGRTLQIYYPKLNTVREYDIVKYKDLAQKLILLGFGMPGRELAANDVNNLGAERVQSEDSVHFQLIPKAADVLKQLSKVDLWISLKTDCPVQQKFYMPGGDYRLVTYSGVKVTPVPDSALDLPNGAKRERMN